MAAALCNGSLIASLKHPLQHDGYQKGKGAKQLSLHIKATALCDFKTTPFPRSLVKKL